MVSVVKRGESDPAAQVGVARDDHVLWRARFVTPESRDLDLAALEEPLAGAGRLAQQVEARRLSAIDL